MKRHEAVTCLREINTNCKNMSPNVVALVDSAPDDQLSTGYQIHIQTALDKETKQQICAITEKCNLAFKEEKNSVVIYKPKKVSQ